MKQDRTDRFLEGAGYVVALVRVLRGEDPAHVIAQTKKMADKARELRVGINAHMGEPEPEQGEEGSHG